MKESQDEVSVGTHDITQLQDALDFAEGIWTTVRLPLLVLDAELHVNRANKAFYRVFKVSEAETQNRHIYQLGNGQWNAPRLRSLLEEILTINTHLEDFEVEHVFPHIGRKIMLLNARRIHQQGRRIQMILLSIEDITERRLAEAKLQTYVEKLEWSNRELQDFAYIASHDLQEPLRAILAFGDRLKAKNGDALTDQGRDYLERMQAAAGRMRTLIQDLLFYSRIATKPNPFITVDLAEVMRSVESDVATRLEETGGHIESGNLPTIEADETQMRQLLQNLVANALKFHRSDEPPVVNVYSQPQDEVDAAWQDHKPAIPAPRGLAAGGQESFCRIVVEDNGIGFDEKYAERIFTPFQRLHSQRQYEGTGIGLAVCRKIVERHGGNISAHSTLGQGSTFIITLPTNQPKEPVL